MSEVTQILAAVDEGDVRAAQRLLPLVYEELRRLAADKLRHEQPGQTLQPTALVHEAYLRLVGGEALTSWDSRGHFFAAAAEAMRRILIDNARRKGRVKHGGGLDRIDLDEATLAIEPPAEDVLALNEALTVLDREDHLKAELVKLRFFAGLTLEEAGRVLGIAPATADRHWAFARAWLFREVRRR
jgi:RNA polymerase sigma factor (TIGR02999 family)